MLHIFQNCYRYFKDNKDNRSGGYGQFLNHLLAYLFHRSLSHKRGRYNPTNKCDTDLFKYHGVKGNPFHHFCIKLMNMTEDEYASVVQNGKTLHFKRAMKSKRNCGVTVLPCESYLKLKRTLKIKGW